MRAPGVFVTPAQIAQFLDRNDAADVRARFTSAFGADNLMHHELSVSEDCVTLFERDVGLAEGPPTQRANSRIDFATLNWLNAVKAELDVPARIVQSAYDAAFERPSCISSAEAAFLAEVADGLSSAKSGLLKAELNRHRAGQAAAQRDYLRQFDRFVSHLRRDMRRRAIKQRLRRLASEAFGRPPNEG
jgi:hypothetical protein